MAWEITIWAELFGSIRRTKQCKCLWIPVEEANDNELRTCDEYIEISDYVQLLEAWCYTGHNSLGKVCVRE